VPDYSHSGGLSGSRWPSIKAWTRPQIRSQALAWSPLGVRPRSPRVYAVSAPRLVTRRRLFDRVRSRSPRRSERDPVPPQDPAPVQLPRCEGLPHPHLTLPYGYPLAVGSLRRIANPPAAKRSEPHALQPGRLAAGACRIPAGGLPIRRRLATCPTKAISGSLPRKPPGHSVQPAAWPEPAHHRDIPPAPSGIPERPYRE